VWQLAADRYTYLPSLVLGVPLTRALLAPPAVAAAYSRADGARRGGGRARPRRAAAALAATAALLCGALGAHAVAAAGHWRDSEALWRRTLGVRAAAHQFFFLASPTHTRARHCGRSSSCVGPPRRCQATTLSCVRSRIRFVRGRFRLLSLPRFPARAAPACSLIRN